MSGEDRCPSWFADGLVVVSSHGRQQGQEASHRASSKGTDLVPKGPTLVTCSPPNPMTLGVKMSAYGFGGTQALSLQQPCFSSPGVLAENADFLGPTQDVSDSQGERPRNLVLTNPRWFLGSGKFGKHRLKPEGHKCDPTVDSTPPPPIPPPPDPSTSRDSDLFHLGVAWRMFL